MELTEQAPSSLENSTCACSFVIQELQLLGYMLAMNDAFLLTLAFAAIAIVALIFVRGGRQRAGRRVQNQQGVSEEGRRAQEATLAV